MTKPNGTWRERTYDSGGCLTRIANHLGERTDIVPDVDGQVLSRNVYSAGGALSLGGQRTFNAHGRLASTIEARNYTTQWLYANDARPAGAINASSQSTTLLIRNDAQQASTSCAGISRWRPQ